MIFTSCSLNSQKDFENSETNVSSESIYESMDEKVNEKVNEDDNQVIVSNNNVPSVVFMKYIDYTNVRENEPFVEIYFYDIMGKEYYTDDDFFTGASFSDFMDRYNDASNHDKLKLVNDDNDIKDMQQFISDFNDVMNDELFELVGPDSGPDEMTEVTMYFGFYYNENDELKTFQFGYIDNTGSHVSNSSKANEIIKELFNS